MKIRMILMATMTLFFLTSLTAQGMLERRIQEERVKFYNQELQFTEAEEDAFWPLFEKYQSDEKALESKYNEGKKLGLLSDAEVEAHIYQMFELQEKKLALKKQYFESLKEKLPIRKVAMLEGTERKFKRMVLKKIQNNRAQRRRN